MKDIDFIKRVLVVCIFFFIWIYPPYTTEVWGLLLFTWIPAILVAGYISEPL